MTAKIETQAPHIGMTAGIDFGTGKDTTMLTLMIDGKLDHASTDGPWGQAILALLAERDLSAAREAAAWIAGRDAAVKQMNDDPTGKASVTADNYPGWFCGRYKSASELTSPTDTTALDRLIAERVREAVEDMWRDCLGALPEMGADPVYPGWVLKTFIDNMQAIRRARGSKEGQS